MSLPGILLPASSQRLWHAGKPYTVHRDLRVCAHVSCCGHAVVPWCFISPSGTKSGADILGGRVLNLSDGVVTNLEEISVHYVTSQQVTELHVFARAS